MIENPVITWRVLNTEAIMSYSSLTNVLRAVYWICEGTDDNNKYGRQWGIQQLNIDNIDESTFISLSSLSSAQVLQWVKNSLNEQQAAVDGGDVSFTQQIENKILEQMESEVIGSRITGIPWS